ncbi:MAG: MBL fold metallo-hydrolase [Acidimicrobiia bacterium]|nr:MBL fold metallo-hydrolase [Acidimicrobiia bacterium]
MSVKISVLGSGSSGNCTFIATSQTKILLDAGLSPTQTQKRLKAIGESLENIDALVISHEHADHINGVPGLLKKKRTLPVYIGRETWAATQPFIQSGALEFISAGEPFQLRDLMISPFAIPHDAVDPLGFTLEAEGIKIGHVTDLGYVTELVIRRLMGCDAIVLESNHDLEMLKVGPYPWALKQRIMSREGHLSNEGASRFLSESFDGQARYIVLAHLSENNNHPDIARMEAAHALQPRGFDLQHLYVGCRNTPSPLIEV